jgi:hypothetical protein
VRETHKRVVDAVDHREGTWVVLNCVEVDASWTSEEIAEKKVLFPRVV